MWTAGALLYSGRPDPSWEVGGDATALIRHFTRLELWAGAMPDRSQLGYRGAWLRAPDGRRWVAHGGVAWLEGGADIRTDEGRGFERALLGTAAPGGLPEELRQFLKNRPGATRILESIRCNLFRSPAHRLAG